MGAATADSKLNIKYIDGPHQQVFVTNIYSYGLTTIAYAREKHVSKHILLNVENEPVILSPELPGSSSLGL